MGEQRDEGAVRRTAGVNRMRSGEERRTVSGYDRARERWTDRSDDLGPGSVEPA